MPYSETDSLHGVKGDANSQEQVIDWIHRHCFDASDIFCWVLNNRIILDIYPV